MPSNFKDFMQIRIEDSKEGVFIIGRSDRQRILKLVDPANPAPARAIQEELLTAERFTALLKDELLPWLEKLSNSPHSTNYTRTTSAIFIGKINGIKELRK
jgi:hypothetical protein